MRGKGEDIGAILFAVNETRTNEILCILTQWRPDRKVDFEIELKFINLFNNYTFIGIDNRLILQYLLLRLIIAKGLK